MPHRTDKQKQIADLLERAESGVKEVFESDNYRNYLITMSKFHHYSYNNSILIMLQRPDATYVAGYNAWRDKFKRHVKRGGKGIQILAFTPKKCYKRGREKRQLQQYSIRPRR